MSSVIRGPDGSPASRVWVIDDSALDREHVTRALGGRFELEAFDHAVVAIERLGDVGRLPDVVVVDWVMPNVDGAAFCRFVREHPVSRSIGLLVLTADDVSAIVALESGADDFVRKPYDGAELSGRVAVLARSRRSERAQAEALDALARLQRFTATLAGCVRVHDIASAVFDHTRSELGADGCVVATAHGGELRIVRAHGFEAELVERFATMSLSERTPLTDAVRNDQPMWIDSSEAMRREYPALANNLREGATSRWAVLPLRASGRLLGAIGVTMRRGAGFSAAERAAFEQLVTVVGAALDRARLYDEEHAARERAAASAAFAEELVAIVSHDLRNPLTAVALSLSQIATSGDLGTTKTSAIRAQRSVRRMDRLVGELLDLTRVRLGSGIPIALGPGNLAVIVNDVATEARAANPLLDLQVDATGDLSGQWDRDRLEQLITNLVANAALHGESGATVRIVVRGDADTVSVDVHNRGPEIAAEMLARIFEPFKHSGAATPQHKSGLGLGLYIAREIARGHHGTIAVTSSKSGTTVRCVFPRFPSPK